jgi:hypothetical protein
MSYFTSKEQTRLDVMARYLEGDIHHEDALTALEVGPRQFRRLIKKFKIEGILSIKHGNFGRSPHNKVKQLIENKIVQLYKLKYKGFNLVHFREKLFGEIDSNKNVPSYSTLRRLLIENKCIAYGPKRIHRVHRPRERYQKEGHFVQIDGSHHKWFGDIETCLIAIIDDATGKILSMKFSPTETTLDTMEVAKNVIEKFGRFQIIYSDKAGIFGDGKRSCFTNFKRAMKQLEIISILAHSPQAKGRIERLFKTLQDRLVSELRLNNITTIEQANCFLEKYTEEHNNKFSITAISSDKGFRELSSAVNLDDIFCTIEGRTILTGNVIQYKRDKYVISENIPYKLKGKWIEVRKYLNKVIKFYLGDEEISVSKIDRFNRKIA